MRALSCAQPCHQKYMDIGWYIFGWGFIFDECVVVLVDNTSIIAKGMGREY